ncbi:MAG: hypothetical protein R3D57_18690 [Hyphomicrobiaceae bacterium]
MCALSRFTFVLLAAALLLPVSAASVLAQTVEPQLTMHRTEAAADDGTGWHRANSTKGKFAVLMPAPFNDFTVSGVDAKIGNFAIHTIGTELPGGVRISVTEMPITPTMTRPRLDDILADWQTKPFQTLSEIERSPTATGERLSFTVVDTVDNAAFTRYELTPNALYTFVIEFRNWRKDEIGAIRDRIYASFKPGS